MTDVSQQGQYWPITDVGQQDRYWSIPMLVNKADIGQ